MNDADVRNAAQAASLIGKYELAAQILLRGQIAACIVCIQLNDGCKPLYLFKDYISSYLAFPGPYCKYNNVRGFASYVGATLYQHVGYVHEECLDTICADFGGYRVLIDKS